MLIRKYFIHNLLSVSFLAGGYGLTVAELGVGVLSHGLTTIDASLFLVHCTTSVSVNTSDIVHHILGVSTSSSRVLGDVYSIARDIIAHVVLVVYMSAQGAGRKGTVLVGH